MAETSPPDSAAYFRKERDRFVALAFCWADLLLELDANHKIVFTAGSTAPVFGLEAAQLIGVPLLSRVSEKDKPLLAQMLHSSNAARQRMENMPIRFVGADRKEIPLIAAGYCLPEFDNHFFLALRLDPLRSLRETQRGLKRDPNSRLFDLQSIASVAEARVNNDAAVSGSNLKLTMVTFDGYQDFRARLDALAQSELMRIVGGCLRAASLDGDTAVQIDEGTFGVVREAGGDDASLTQHLMQAARNSDPSGKGVRVRSNSIALAKLDNDPKTIGKSLLTALRKIQDDVEVISRAGGFEKFVSQTQNAIEELRNVIEQERFGVAFQPVYDLSSGQIDHFEALARFPKYVDQTAEQISMVRESGLIQRFDLAMIERVMNWVSLQIEKGYRYKLSANISADALGDRKTLEALLNQLDVYDTLKSEVHFEITDAGRVGNAVELNQVIQQLRIRGWRVCLDDFGIGTPSMDFLATVQADMVKIDQSLVQKAAYEPSVAKKLAFNVNLARGFGMKVIAEGIETESQYQLVNKLHFDMAQGYMLGKPSMNIVDFGRPRRAQ